MTGLALVALMIQAELPVQSASAAIDEERTLSAVAGTQRVGASGLLPDKAGAFVAELSYAYRDRYLLAGLARQLPLYEGTFLSLTTALGGTFTSTAAGAVVMGGGPEASLNLGVGKAFQGALALSLGAQLFTDNGQLSPLHVPARASLGILLRRGRFRAEVWGRAGADFIPGLSPAVRYEASAIFGVTL